MAKMVVQEKLEQISAIPSGAVVRMASCAEQQGYQALVSGVGSTERQTSVFEGTPITTDLEFSYNAEVENQCSVWNPLCYIVNRLGFRGRTIVSPRI